MQNPRVLYLSYDGLTDPLGQSQVLPYVVGLSRKGYVFSIVSFEKKNTFHPREKEIKTICQENNIDWTPLQYHKSPPVLSTLYDVWKLWREVKKIHQQGGFEIIHCRSYITSLIGLRAKRKWNVKFIFDMRGFWADERTEGGLWNLRNPLYKLVYIFFKKKEQQFLGEADHIISLTYNAKREIESWKINTPITVIPTCVDLDLFDPTKITKEDRDELRRKLKVSENDFVLLYLGSWGTWYLTREMLDFFADLKSKKINAKFLIVSADKIDLDQYQFKENVVITHSVRHQVPVHISLANISICFIKPSFSKKASSATKLAEILAMNVPVITNNGWGDISEIEKETKAVIFANENSRTPELSNKNAIESRSYCSQRFSLEAGVAKYLTVYGSIAS